MEQGGQLSENPLATRDRLLTLLAHEPGLHLREIPRRLGLSLRAARYHLESLEGDARVVLHRNDGFVRYFRAGEYDAEERATIGALRVRGHREVVRALLRANPLGFNELAMHSALSHSALAAALRKLQLEGLVTRQAAGRYLLLDAPRSTMCLALLRPTLGDALADSAVDVFG